MAAVGIIAQVARYHRNDDLPFPTTLPSANMAVRRAPLASCGLNQWIVWCVMYMNWLFFMKNRL